MNTLVLLVAQLLGHLGALHPPEPHLDRFTCLSEAYPAAEMKLVPDPETGRALVQIGEDRLRWDDGRGDKDLATMLADADVHDTLVQRYAIGPGSVPPGKDHDPGRVRVTELSHALYGDSPAAVRSALEPVEWMPGHGGRTLMFNSRHGAAEALRRVSADLEQLPAEFHRYVKISAGTFNWRHIAGTKRLSAHSHAIAIDIDVKYSHYWRWSLKREPHLPWRNAIPLEIVDVFERHGFIWGGKWHHYDTMHFEYRPELLHPTCVDDRRIAQR